MTDCDSRTAQTADFVGREMDSVCEPSPRRQPAAGFQVIHTPQTQPIFAVCVLVEVLSEVVMQTHVQLFCQLRTAHHYRLAHRER